jgi:S1-C subfamily serine protease
LQVNDIILKINNQAITGKGTFEEEMAYYNPGDIISLNIRRGKTAKVLQLKLVNRDGTAELVKKSIYQSKSLGADFETVSKAEKAKLGIAAGIRIAKVYSNGALYRLGLDEGFIITSINRTMPEDPAELERLISNAKGRLLIEGVDKNGSKGYYSFGG